MLKKEILMAYISGHGTTFGRKFPFLVITKKENISKIGNLMDYISSLRRSFESKISFFGNYQKRKLLPKKEILMAYIGDLKMILG